MSVTPGLTPEILTFDEIKRWSAQEMKDQMKRSDEMRYRVAEVVRAQSLEDIEAAQKQIESNPTETLVADEGSLAIDEPVVPVVDEAALAREAAREVALALENQQLAEAGISVTRDEYGNITKLVQDYQATDENKNSLGRPTHLEARSWPELSIKQREAHVQATRAFHRLKGQKVTFKETQPVATRNLSDSELLEAMKDLKSDDPEKQLAAIRKVQRAEKDKLDAEQAEIQRQAAVSKRFLARHTEDFYNCQANIQQVKEYFEQNPELTWTDDNLEICFLAIESKLAPVPQQSVAFTAPANPVPATPVVQPTVKATPVAVPAVQPVSTTPAQVPAANNPPAATPRPGVNGGLVPGESSATRPGPAKPKKLTAEEVKSWSSDQMKKNMRDPHMRPLIEEFVRERNQRPSR